MQLEPAVYTGTYHKALPLDVDQIRFKIEHLQDRAVRSSTISSLENMGHHFGDLAKIRHIVTYSLSPFEQRAFANYFSKGIPNVWRRFSSSVFKVAPPMILVYLTYTWGNHVHQQSKKKNPADYENDE